MQHALGGDTPRSSRFIHDLRQYVAAGKYLTDPMDIGADDPLAERLSTLHVIFEQIDALVGQAADERLRNSRLDLVPLVDDCVRVARMASTVPIETQYAGSPRAWGDPVMLRRAVANVLDNAARAAGVEGHVTVAVCEHPEGSYVEVADDGPGFARISSVSGLGMSVVDVAVREAGGTLEIASGPGPGTRVRLRLPGPQNGGMS